MSKSTQKAARRSASMVALINSASELGYAFSGGFEAACAAAAKLVPANYLSLSDDSRKPFAERIRDFGIQFKAGHLLRYLENRGYNRRFGNMDRKRKLEACVAIFDKARPDNQEKSDRRTDLEHKGCRSADEAWTRVRGASGLKPPAPKRSPSKRRAAGDEKESKTPVSLAAIKTPRVPAAIDAIQFIQQVAKKLDEFQRMNALAVPPQLSSAINDFSHDVAKGIKLLKDIGHSAVKPKGKAATRKPKAPKLPAGAAANGSGQPNGAGASVQ